MIVYSISNMNWLIIVYISFGIFIEVISAAEKEQKKNAPRIRLLQARGKTLQNVPAKPQILRKQPKASPPNPLLYPSPFGSLPNYGAPAIFIPSAPSAGGALQAAAPLIQPSLPLVQPAVPSVQPPPIPVAPGAFSFPGGPCAPSGGPPTCVASSICLGTGICDCPFGFAKTRYFCINPAPLPPTVLPAPPVAMPPAIPPSPPLPPVPFPQPIPIDSSLSVPISFPARYFQIAPALASMGPSPLSVDFSSLASLPLGLRWALIGLIPIREIPMPLAPIQMPLAVKSPPPLPPLPPLPPPPAPPLNPLIPFPPRSITPADLANLFSPSPMSVPPISIWNSPSLSGPPFAYGPSSMPAFGPGPVAAPYGGTAASVLPITYGSMPDPGPFPGPGSFPLPFVTSPIFNYAPSVSQNAPTESNSEKKFVSRAADFAALSEHNPNAETPSILVHNSVPLSETVFGKCLLQHQESKKQNLAFVANDQNNYESASENKKRKAR